MRSILPGDRLVPSPFELTFDERPTEVGDHAPPELELGARVKILSLSRGGTVSAIRGTQAQVMVDGKRLWVATSDLAPFTTRLTPRQEWLLFNIMHEAASRSCPRGHTFDY